MSMVFNDGNDTTISMDMMLDKIDLHLWWPLNDTIHDDDTFIVK